MIRKINIQDYAQRDDPRIVKTKKLGRAIVISYQSRQANRAIMENS